MNIIKNRHMYILSYYEEEGTHIFCCYGPIVINFIGIEMLIQSYCVLYFSDKPGITQPSFNHAYGF